VLRNDKTIFDIAAPFIKDFFIDRKENSKMTNSRQMNFLNIFKKKMTILINRGTIFPYALSGLKSSQELIFSSQLAGNVSNKQLVAVAVSYDALLLTDLFFKSLRSVRKNLTQDFATIKILIQNNNIV